MSKIKKVVLAYSGGLDTSVILKWIQQAYSCEVVTFTADLGQEDELDKLEAKALAVGASKVLIADLREEFASDFLFPMLRACAVYEGRYLLGTSIARPLIAKQQVEFALAEGAQAVAHGATGKGNDQVRFELTVNALAPELKVIAPWREWDMKSRSDLLAFAVANDISVSVTKECSYSMDRNLWHCSFEGGELEDPWTEPGPNCHAMVTPLHETLDEPQLLTIGFEAGNPVSLDGVRLSPAKLIQELNRIAGRHGVGRIDMVENRFVGMKSRGVYETPAGTVLHIAKRDLEGICLDREVLHLRDSLIPRYAECVYYGFWYSPEREALQALIDTTQTRVTGEIRMKLFKGAVHTLGRRSPFSLYNTALVTFETDWIYNQADAAGFIRLQSIRLHGYKRLKL
ncbi:Argininosuccinate synthase [Desulfovibrionales bacterium]